MTRETETSRRHAWTRGSSRRAVALGGIAATALIAGGSVAAAAATTTAAGPTTAAAATTMATTTTTAATAPPPVTVVAGGKAKGPGDIFITPTGQSTAYANGAEILTRAGRKLWFHAAPAGDDDADLRVQRLHGHPVLTFWEGSGLGSLSNGTDLIYNSRYRLVRTLHAGGGLSTDGHEFLISPWNTAFVISYDKRTANLTTLGGPAHQTIVDCVVQELDVRTGRVLWSWDAAQHVPFTQSEQPLPASASIPWDWFHMNAVKVDGRGSVIVDARNTWTAYDVSLRSGRIVWQLGGKASSFRLIAAKGQSLNRAGRIFAWQHDPQPIGSNEFTFFDNEAAGAGNTGTGVTSEYSSSRIDVVRLDFKRRTATLVASRNQPEGQLASSQGNGQLVSNGDEFVGWGDLNSISEFGPSGALVFNARFPTGINTYRAYLEPWSGVVGAR